MAFLCPVRIRSGSSDNNNGARKKKQSDKKRSFLSATVNSLIGGGGEREKRVGEVVQGPGRITGSSSVETLVRVGIEKEQEREGLRSVVVLCDFSPCVDDELGVVRGEVVKVLWEELPDWVYVVGGRLGGEGFIPYSYCAPYVGGSGGGEFGGVVREGEKFGGGSVSRSDGVGMVPFFKDPSPTRFIALYKFTARDENDVNVERGELLTVLNKDDPDWYYVVRSDGGEGFVPSAFVYPLAGGGGGGGLGNGDVVGEQNNQEQSSSSPINQSSSSPSQQSQGTELVMLYDYKAQAPDDLSLRRGEWAYADLSNQTVDGWVWVYSPKLRKYGFVPKAYARPPAMTSL